MRLRRAGERQNVRRLLTYARVFIIIYTYRAMYARVHKETAVRCVEMSSSGKITQYFKGLNRHQKIAWIVAAVLVALLIAGAVTAAVLLTRGKDADPVAGEYKRYSYAIAPGNSTGYYIDDSFAGDVPISDFKIDAVKSASGVELASDMKLTAGGATAGDRAEYSISLNGAEKAYVVVNVVEIDEIITTVEGLAALNGKSGVYVLGADVDVSALLESIPRFYGSLYGNHHRLYGIKLPTGVFKELVFARVVGVELEADISASLSSGGSFGTLAAEALNADVSYCTVTGSMSITADCERTAAVAAGGLVGTFTAGVRNSPGSAAKVISECSTTLKLSLTSDGQVRLGGIAGVIENASVYDTRVSGKITFNGNAEGLRALYAGGIAGVATKDYGSATPSGGALEECSRISSYAEISVTVSGNTDLFASETGGIFGQINGVSLNNAVFGGKLSVFADGIAVYAGGIAARALNPTSLTLKVRNVSVSGEIYVYTLCNAYAGGIAGAFEKGDNIEYSAVNGSVMPEIDTDKSSVTALQKASEGVANL